MVVVLDGHNLGMIVVLQSHRPGAVDHDERLIVRRESQIACLVVQPDMKIMNPLLEVQ